MARVNGIRALGRSPGRSTTGVRNRGHGWVFVILTPEPIDCIHGTGSSPDLAVVAPPDECGIAGWLERVRMLPDARVSVRTQTQMKPLASLRTHGDVATLAGLQPPTGRPSGCVNTGRAKEGRVPTRHFALRRGMAEPSAVATACAPLTHATESERAPVPARLSRDDPERVRRTVPW